MRQIITNNLAIWTTAPNGIKKLRELILELAVRGLLVPQDPNDEPASALLTKIAAEKARLVSEGIIKPPKALAKISEEEKPFDLPMGWEWVRLGDLGITQTGTTPATNEPDFFGNAYPFIKPANILYDSINYPKEGLSEKGIEKGRLIKAFSVLMVCIGGSIGKVNFVDRDCSCNQQINAITPYLGNIKLLNYFMRSNFFQEQVLFEAPQTTLPILNKGKWEKLLLPLPPFNEQQRIVAKVDELMQLCDRLEEKQNGSQEMHRQLVSCLLTTLTEASDAQAFQTAWSRIAANFDCLFTTENSIEQLKQTILHLAVMGKLVPQNPNDEPASELLKKIATEKARLITEGKIKKQNPLPKISEQEKPFALPNGWAWARLGDLLSKIGAGSTPLGGKNVYVDSGIKFLRSQNVWNEGLNLNGVAFITESTHYKMWGTEVCAGDLLFNITGASIGRCALVPDNFDTANVSQHVTIVRPVNAQIKIYLHKLLISPSIQQTVMDVQVGVSREGLSISKLGQFVIAIPPIEEQHSIVAKVDELMVLCEQLKTKLATAQTLQQQLAETLVQQAVA